MGSAICSSKGRDLGTVLRPASGQIRGDDLTRVGINSEVHLLHALFLGGVRK